jgi:hypothetical protein
MEVVAFVVLAVAWVAVVARLAFDRLGSRPVPPGRRLQGYGILLIMTGLLAGVSRWRILHDLVLPLVLCGLVILAAGLVRRGRRAGTGGRRDGDRRP